MNKIYRNLAAKASTSLFPRRLLVGTYAAAPLAQEKTEVNGTINIIGDSLSDAGNKNGKYNKKIFGLIPYRWFLHQSPNNQFTNGNVWTYPLQLRIKHQLQEMSIGNPLYNIHSHSIGKNVVGKNMAEGGATAYNYRRFINFFRRIKGFILSFFLGNIEKQSYGLKKEGKGIKPNDLNLIFAGANDFVTVGYCNEGGVSRAIEGIQTAIDLLTITQKKTGSENYSKNVVLFTLPDFSKTPRFHNKTEKEKAQASEMCLRFNEALKDLARSYRYVDFRFCDIFQIENKEDIGKFLPKITRQGIIVVGKGHHRTVYFAENGELILQPAKDEPVVVKVKLPNEQQKMMGLKQGKVERNTKNTIFLDEWVCQLASQAKLDTDVKVFDAAAVFNEVDENPEKYGFTSGCAIYYRFNKCESPIRGNAIVLSKTKDNELEVLFFQQGELVKTKDGKARKVTLKLPAEVQAQLDLTLRNQSTEKARKKVSFFTQPLTETKDDSSIGDQLSAQRMLELVGSEQKHALWQARIIQAAVNEYQHGFDQKIRLADIYTSILLQMKKHLPHQNRVFWDDLHPTTEIHFLLEHVFGGFFTNHYKLQLPRQWLDDTAILQRKENSEGLLPFKSHEAPASIPSLNPKKAIQSVASSQPRIMTASFAGGNSRRVTHLEKRNDNGRPVRLLSSSKGYYRDFQLMLYPRSYLFNEEKKAIDRSDERHLFVNSLTK